MWQWNCAGFVSKRATLRQYLKGIKDKPQVITLQETITSSHIRLPGFVTVASTEGGRGVATLVSKRFTCIQRDLGPADNGVEYVMTELLVDPPKRCLRRNSIFILNVYCRPSVHRARAGGLLKKAVHFAGCQPLVVMGDFNAQHQAWGYLTNTKKGRDIWLTATEEDLTLVTNKDFPTRRGNSVCRDTTPDLTFVKSLENVKWTNTAIDLGSDHCIIEVLIEVARNKTRTFKFIDWDLFRANRSERALSPDADLDSWCDGLKEDVASATKEVTTDLEVDRMDSRLAHLLEAKQALLARWKTQRHNRRLRKKMSEINKTVGDHCKVLCKQQWDELCDSMEGQLKTGKSWRLLKHLLHDGNTKSNQKRALAKAVHLATDSTPDEAITEKLIDKYLAATDDPVPPQFPDYEGRDAPSMDEDFTVAEVKRVLASLNSRSAPGPDGVTNKMLKHLDDDSIEFLTDKINEIWRSGLIPKSWKAACTVLIPKPGKAPSIENLRPISLTSCVGKVAEHAMLNRLTDHLESNECYTHNMIGFRSGLSTQDAMKLIKHQVIDSGSADTKAILGLDLEKAFDNISHAFILKSLSEFHVGKRAYNFVRSFLSSRSTRLKIDDFLTHEITLGPKGTPQGAVISPTLFNICMINLSRALNKIPNINHTIYADDITIWCLSGCEGQVESALQEAIDVTERYLIPTGLRCSPAKSELLLYKKRPRGGSHRSWKPAMESHITLFTGNGSPVPRVDTIRVLGMFIESNGANGAAVKRICSKTESALGLIRRIANRHRGIREDNLIRIIHAFVLCHLAYSAAMHNWLVSERNKINALIRRVFKLALGIPVRTHTEDLLKLGIHNTFEEIVEAQEFAQFVRLSGTPAGRAILGMLGRNPTVVGPDAVKLPNDVRSKIQIARMPRNMHPTYNEARRRARGKSLLASARLDKDRACFVDAASYIQEEAFSSVVVDCDCRVISCATIRTSSSSVAEQVAIALALTDGVHDTIYSDSKAAIKAFQMGMVAPQVLQIIQKVKDLKNHSLVWFPAHLGTIEGASLNPNEEAHSAARGLTDRVPGNASSPGRPEPLCSYNEICKHHYLSRRLLPLPHSSLCRAQAVTLRLLQTNTYPSPAALHTMYPERFPSPDCPLCGGYADFEHVLWGCASAGPPFTQEEMKRLIKAQDQTSQILAVQRARARAVRFNLMVPEWA